LWAAPEQAKSSAVKNDDLNMVCDDADDCEDIVWDKVEEWREFYGEPELLQHKKMWDLLTCDKEGRSKEQSFSKWCRRVARHRKTVSTATGQAGADSTATEHAETNSFQALSEDILKNDLTLKQLRDPVYKLRQDRAITGKQHSTINVILRKSLGDPKVVDFIFSHGVPDLLGLHGSITSPTQRAPLQTMLEDLMIWHASLLRSLVKRQEHPDMATARMLSDLDQKPWNSQRRQNYTSVTLTRIFATFCLGS